MSQEGLWQRLARGVWRLRQRADWARFAGGDWPSRIMDVPVTDRFHAKQGRSTGRWILQTNEARLAVYLKRHYRLSWWRGWLAALWPDAGWSPALQECRHLEWARDRGIPVPEIVAAGERIGPWGKLTSFLAVAELTDMLPLHEAIPLAAARLDAKTFRIWKRGLTRELVRLVRELHGRRWFHKDLYLCHFYIPQESLHPVGEWKGLVHMIDLHRLQHHGWTWPVWQVKDLAQLLYSSDIIGVELRDRLCFWKAYRRYCRDTFSRLLRWCVELKWRRYRRHNRKSHP